MAHPAASGYNRGPEQEDPRCRLNNPEGEKAGPEKQGESAPEGVDLTPILEAWEYDESNTVRRMRAADGHEIIQVRLPLGIEQYEVSGRPDGKRPMDEESWLHHYSRKAEVRPVGSADRFLGDSDFQRLYHEGLLYYYRYLLFFQIQEYRHCARDTRRNLRLLDFVKRHALPELSEQLEQYRPYILRMHVMSRALHRIKLSGDVRSALRLLRGGRKAIESLEPIEGNQVHEWEMARALTSLDDLISQLEAQRPVSKLEKLQRQMEAAIQEENYEKAALIRDQLTRMKQKPKSYEMG